MKKEWKVVDDDINVRYHQYHCDSFGKDVIFYEINYCVSEGTEYYIELNDRFRNFVNFLGLQELDTLKHKLRVCPIQFLLPVTSSDPVVVFEKTLYAKLHSPNYGEPEIFQTFDLSLDGNIEWKSSLEEEVEFYVSLCKKQVEIWESEND